MAMIGAYEARTHLAKLLDRAACSESLTITRYGKPVAKLVPAETERARARDALNRIIGRRQHVKLVPLAELAASVHERHRY